MNELYKKTKSLSFIINDDVHVITKDLLYQLKQILFLLSLNCIISLSNIKQHQI